MREKIFVSYSHKDAASLAILRDALGTGIYAKAFEMWSDQDIGTGKNWRHEIEAAIASSRIALLLVSRNFLRSDFIIKAELPSILSRNESSQPGQHEALSIWLVPLERISEAELQYARLDKFQAAVDPSRPLFELDEKGRADAIGQLSAKLMQALRLLSDFSPAARDKFQEQVESALASRNTTIVAALAPGDYSIIYRAKRGDGEEVAIKALVPLPRREWMAKDFIDRARSVRKVGNSTAVGIRDVVDRKTKCVVMEFVSAPTLRKQLKQEGDCLPCMRAADILAQLAGLAADLHQLDGQPVIGPIRLSHVHYDHATKRARISLVHIANETLKSCLQRPTLLLDSDALTYLSPERYHGRKVDALTDQYYLGLLGLELLQGKPPVEVSAFADLERKRKFFESPRDFFYDLPRRQPAFSFVLTRMLEQEPQNRWASMSELAAALRELAAGSVPKAVKQRAIDDYSAKLNNMEFFDLFYKVLFNSSHEIGAIFTERGVSMKEQYRKLNQALGFLFYFDSSMQLTSLDPHADKHRDFGLKPDHFASFGAAFMDALRDTGITDPYSLDAWRAILDPALAFMSEKASREAVKLVSQEPTAAVLAATRPRRGRRREGTGIQRAVGASRRS